MKRKAFLVASLAALVCSCQQAQQSQGSNGSGSEDQNFEQRRKDMQQMQNQPKTQNKGCCEAPKVETTEAQTAASPELKKE